MICEGQIVLFDFPKADRSDTVLRPALVVRRAPGPYDDWLVCMISTQLSQQVSGFDELIDEKDVDFQSSGLKQSSIVRISRLAVVNVELLSGTVGEIVAARLERVQTKLSDWIKGGNA